MAKEQKMLQTKYKTKALTTPRPLSLARVAKRQLKAKSAST